MELGAGFALPPTPGAAVGGGDVALWAFGSGVCSVVVVPEVPVGWVYWFSTFGPPAVEWFSVVHAVLVAAACLFVGPVVRVWGVGVSASCSFVGAVGASGAGLDEGWAVGADPHGGLLVLRCGPAVLERCCRVGAAQVGVVGPGPGTGSWSRWAGGESPGFAQPGRPSRFMSRSGAVLTPHRPGVTRPWVCGALPWAGVPDHRSGAFATCGVVLIVRQVGLVVQLRHAGAMASLHLGLSGGQCRLVDQTSSRQR